MDGPRLGSAREEAERLVVTGLAVASTALRGMEANRQLRGLAEQVLGSDRMHDLAAGLAGFVSGLGRNDDAPAGEPPAGASEPAAGASSRERSAGPAAGWSTGSADCCVCPVCRLIAALRDPSPEFAERLASAAGDLAVGISGLLRALSGVVPAAGHQAEHGPWRRPETDDPWRRPETDDPWRRYQTETDDPWRAATRATAPARDEAAGHDPAAATGTAYSTPTMAAEASAPASKPAAKRTAAKKGAAKKTAAKKATVGKATATEPVARKVTAKKAVAKKAVRKAVPRDPGDGPHNR